MSAPPVMSASSEPVGSPTLVFGALEGHAAAEDGSGKCWPSSPSLPSFSVTKTSPTGSAYTVVRPCVVYGSDVQYLSPGSFASGSVWCNVSWKRDGEYNIIGVSASLGSSPQPGPDVCATVPVAVITAQGVQQYHVGAVVIPKVEEARRQKVVVRSVYNPNTRTFFNKVRKVRVLKDDVVDAEASTSESVFVAVSVCKCGDE